MNLPDFASHWARELGSRAESLVRLEGGINNHVFRCGSDGQFWVIKNYPIHKPGQRDRMQAEVEFLRYAHLVAPERVPKLVSIDSERRCVVLEYIEGLSYPEGIAPPAEDVEAAVNFFHLLNKDLVIARQMISLDAAEGFLSLRQHMSNVRERLAKMGSAHLSPAFRSEAKKMLAEMNHDADLIEMELEDAIDKGLIQDHLDPELRCVSPSDFGFHNAIRTNQGVRFIDFEFAGWDDPTKTIADFTLQQRNPVDISYIRMHAHFFPSDEARCLPRLKMLHRILRLKWSTIIMSILNPSRLQIMLSLNCCDSSDNLVALHVNRFLRYKANDST